MGLKRAPSYFQQQMERILGDTGLVFIDDVLTGSDCKADYSNFDEHLAAVRRMLDKLLKHGLTLDPKKCHWAQRSIKFLGHTLSNGCVEMEPSKVAAILAISSPTDAVALRSWIHMVGYYQRLIPRFSEMTEPLRRLLKNNVPYVWGVEQQAAFDQLRVALTSKPVLAIARPDCLFILSTDWSKKGSSAILSQIWADGIERVIAYASRSHSTAESNYSSYKGEMMAAVWGVDHFQYYLTGRPFKLLTDHEPLTWLLSNERLTGIYYRWAMRLSEFDIEITYRPGSANPADLPSRFPLPDSQEGWDNFKSDIELLEIAQPVAYLALLNLSLLEYPMLPAATLHALYHQPNPSAGGDLFEDEGYEPDLSGIDMELDAPAKSELQYLMVLGEASRKLHPDVYNDEHVMRWLKEPTVPTPSWFLELPPHERNRIKIRAQSYLWDTFHNQLIYIASDGIKRIVPVPSVRAELVTNAHKEYGHACPRRLLSMITFQFWWHNMASMVEDECKSCLPCSQSKTHFTAKNPRLQSLPVVFGFERVHVDLAGPFEPSAEGFRYVMIIVDSFTSWVILVGLRDKASATTMAAIRDWWITVYGAMSTLTSDNGAEWAGKFAEYLQSIGVTQRFTSPDHPQGNGKAENVVKTVKKALSAYVADLTEVKEWGSKLGHIGMALRFSRQGSLRMSPFQLVFGSNPHLPNRVAVVLDEPLYEDNPVEQAASLQRKVDALNRWTPLAREYREAANLRNEARYQTRRSGNYRAKNKWYLPGDYVYIQRKATGKSFTTRAAPGVYRVVRVEQSGVLVLQGRCGGTFIEHGENCAPCWVSHLDHKIDHNLAKARFDMSDKAFTACQVCKKQHSAADGREEMLICSNCYSGWHLSCAETSTVPSGDWYCPYCVKYQNFNNPV